MSDPFGSPPVIPDQLQPYNSYLTDPQWQVKFSIIWSSVVGFFVFMSTPKIIRAFQSGRGVYWFKTWFLSSESNNNGGDRIPDGGVITQKLDGVRRQQKSKIIILAKLAALSYLTIPGIGKNLAQIILLLTYFSVSIVCIIKGSELLDNPNRAGFIALAQLPLVFLLATKNSVLSFLLGPGIGYEKLNIFHRWAGRVLFLCASIHGSLWIRNHLQYGLEILGPQKETSGVISFALLSGIFLISLSPVRKYFYETFFSLHLVLSFAFLVALCYHTSYAFPWIFPPLAFYSLDIFLRMLRHHFMDGFLVPIDTQMTLVHIPHLKLGWLGGQHVRLRVFFSGRVFESHPLTILKATPDLSCITSLPPGMSFAVRSCGDWSEALNKYANEALQTDSPIEVPVYVLLDGPYGGCSLDLGDYESVFLFAGGSGITFTLGLLDDIIGRCLKKGRRNGEKTRRIEFAWCIKSFGQLEWFASALMDISSLVASSVLTHSFDLHISVYVTCLCNPEALPSITNCDVTPSRPSVHQLLLDFITPLAVTAIPNSQSSPSTTHDDTMTPRELPSVDARTENMDEEQGALPLRKKLPWIALGGGIAVCASGPASLTTETANAFSRIQLSGNGRDLGEMGLHTETFSL